MSEASSGSPRLARSIISWVVLAGLVVAGVLLWNNRTVVADEFRLIGYTPPADIAKLASDITFTPEGQRYFYASHPAVEDKATFNQDCGNTEVHATILGCYTRYTIYVYNVTDSRLAGVQQVTAAHEMLHAAYDRLSSSERSRVDAMLQRQYDALSSNTEFTDRFSVYNSLSQAEKINELHSILGTEVTGLSSELESYYAQYFKDRHVVTGFYTAYESQFETLKNQLTTLKAEIDTLKKQIDTDEAQYEADRIALNADIQAFNTRANSGYYSSQSQFNRDRNALIARSNNLNATANAINTNINTYNARIREYNDVSIQTQDLQNSLNSQSVESAPSV